jgi:radical SAM protein with 4Fe4S-binding SPASM domain
MPSMFDRLRQRAHDSCIPLNVTLELTLRCNLRCVHCYNFDRDLPYLPLKRREDELSAPEILRILDEVREEGCLYLALSGGEALLHPQLDEFVAHGARAGMMMTVKSNGTLLDPERVRRLRAAGAAAIEISVYGARPETHDAFVKAPGALERTIAGARAARDAGLRVKLSFVVVQKNAAEAGAMVALAEELDVPYGVDPQITARYDGSRGSLGLPVDRATLAAIYRGPLEHLVPAAVENPTSVQCSCARSVAGISAFGEVYPCIGAPVPSGNLRLQSFRDIWRDSPQLKGIRGLTLDDFQACKPCPHLGHCRRSSGVIYSNTGLYTGPAKLGDDWTCMEAEVLHELHDERPGLPAGPSAGALRRHSIE